ncbi:hypothetical protein N7466_006368 [Penicillium verhagenii]|uniref:uncharacterized protein n=1 Tax=Penicillium verhagenii TaxID=1562060 RepID=UPI0025455A2F|nr:uncharacterized protein N7466_006368 [Penicillium verhagenii]KAJ5930875.1 hypothetical protein N7466_006368 [Penicillium verhagenii]
MSGKVLLFSQSSVEPALIIPSTNTQPSVQISYRDLHEATARAQSQLADLGIGPGSRVALAIRNRIEFVIILLALARQRATASPVNPDFALRESSELLGYMKPAFTFVEANTKSAVSDANIIEASKLQGVPVVKAAWDSQAGKIEIITDDEHQSVPVVPTPDIQSDDAVLLHYTSGTTGLPKAVALTHKHIIASCDIIIKAHELSSQDRTMLVAPMFHVGGTCSSLFSTLCSGGCVIIPPSLSGTFWHQFKDYEATWYHAVSTLHRLLLSFPRPAEPPMIRFVRSGGTGISKDLVQLLEKELSCPVLEGYGMTETAQAVFTNNLRHTVRRVGFYPIPEEISVKFLVQDKEGISSLIFEPGVQGEICVRGDCVIDGYSDFPEANKEAFFDHYFRTGDVGIVDSDGFLQVTGRIKEMINKGGEKISPHEIEELMMSHNAVKEVACFRVEDPAYGEEIGVAIVPHEDHILSALDIKKFARQNATLFKVPKKVKDIDKSAFMFTFPTLFTYHIIDRLSFCLRFL